MPAYNNAFSPWLCLRKRVHLTANYLICLLDASRLRHPPEPAGATVAILGVDCGLLEARDGEC